MKKKVNTDAIKNELEGSVFFPLPSQSATPPQNQEGSHEGKAVHANASTRSDERTNVQTDERTKTRHPFDIFQDQLMSLALIQNTIFQTTKKKPTLGSLVQNALDEFIKKWENVRTDERTNERTLERTNV